MSIEGLGVDSNLAEPSKENLTKSFAGKKQLSKKKNLRNTPVGEQVHVFLPRTFRSLRIKH